jgi:hypothetical protein
MYSWSRPIVFECAVLVKEVEEVQNGGGNEVESGRVNIGLFSVKVKNYGSLEFCRRVDVSEEPAASMDSAFILPDNRGCTVD